MPSLNSERGGGSDHRERPALARSRPGSLATTGSGLGFPWAGRPGEGAEGWSTDGSLTWDKEPGTGELRQDAPASWVFITAALANVSPRPWTPRPSRPPGNFIRAERRGRATQSGKGAELWGRWRVACERREPAEESKLHRQSPRDLKTRLGALALQAFTVCGALVHVCLLT